MCGVNNVRLFSPSAPVPIVVVVAVLILTHCYNAVRGHRTGSNNSGAEVYFRRKKKKKTEDRIDGA